MRYLGRICGLAVFVALLAMGRDAAAQQAAPYYRWEQAARVPTFDAPIPPDSARPSTGQRFAFALLGSFAGMGAAVVIDQPYVGAVTWPLGAIVGVGLANRKVYDHWDLGPAALGTAIGSIPIVLALYGCSTADVKEFCGLVALPSIVTVPLGAAMGYWFWE